MNRIVLVRLLEDIGIEECHEFGDVSNLYFLQTVEESPKSPLLFKIHTQVSLYRLLINSDDYGYNRECLESGLYDQVIDPVNFHDFKYNGLQMKFSKKANRKINEAKPGDDGRYPKNWTRILSCTKLGVYEKIQLQGLA